MTGMLGTIGHLDRADLLIGMVGYVGFKIFCRGSDSSEILSAFFFSAGASNETKPEAIFSVRKILVGLNNV